MLATIHVMLLMLVIVLTFVGTDAVRVLSLKEHSSVLCPPLQTLCTPPHFLCRSTTYMYSVLLAGNGACADAGHDA